MRMLTKYARIGATVVSVVESRLGIVPLYCVVGVVAATVSKVM